MRWLKRLRSKISGFGFWYYWWNLTILAYTFLAGFQTAKHHYFMMGEFIVFVIFFIVLSEKMPI